MARAPDQQYPDFPKRVAYLIDPDGIIRKTYEVSDVSGFGAQTLADLQSLQRV